ncbi:hypothetical protein H4R33_007160, partial [Dimargaris cristalligena]
RIEFVHRRIENDFRRSIEALGPNYRLPQAVADSNEPISSRTRRGTQAVVAASEPPARTSSEARALQRREETDPVTQPTRRTRGVRPESSAAASTPVNPDNTPGLPRYEEWDAATPPRIEISDSPNTAMSQPPNPTPPAPARSSDPYQEILVMLREQSVAHAQTQERLADSILRITDRMQGMEEQQTAFQQRENTTQETLRRIEAALAARPGNAPPSAPSTSTPSAPSPAQPQTSTPVRSNVPRSSYQNLQFQLPSFNDTQYYDAQEQLTPRAPNRIAPQLPPPRPSNPVPPTIPTPQSGSTGSTNYAGRSLSRLKEKDTSSILAWLTQVDYIAKAGNWDDEDIMGNAIAAASLELQKWYELFQDRCPTWPDFKRELIRDLTGGDLYADCKHKMERLTWDPKTEYLHHFTQVLTLGKQGEINQTEIRHHLLRVLKESWYKDLFYAEYTEWHDLYGAVIRRLKQESFELQYDRSHNNVRRERFRSSGTPGGVKPAFTKFPPKTGTFQTSDKPYPPKSNACFICGK